MPVTIQPTTLKYKDSNGQFISADCLKGDPVDVQVNGTSIVENSVANIPLASNNSTPGVVIPNSNDGIGVTSSGKLYINTPSDSAIKAGTNQYAPITAVKQHQAVFYGLAKASGDTTQSASANAVGVYTDEAKTAIQNMLGIHGIEVVRLI